MWGMFPDANRAFNTRILLLIHNRDSMVGSYIDGKDIWKWTVQSIYKTHSEVAGKGLKSIITSVLSFGIDTDLYKWTQSL